MDHNSTHSSYQSIIEIKHHFNLHHHQITKILIHRTHQNPYRHLGYCQIYYFMKIQTFTPSLFVHYYYHIMKKSLFMLDSNLLKDFKGYLNFRMMILLQVMMISHPGMHLLIMFTIIITSQLLMQIIELYLAEVLAKLFIEERL